MNVTTPGISTNAVEDVGVAEVLDHKFAHRLRETARGDGPHLALQLLHGAAGPDTLICGPAGHAIAPPDLAVRAKRLVLGTVVVDPTSEVTADLTTWVLDALDLVALKYKGDPPAGAEQTHQAFLWGLAWVRLGLSERLLSASLAHLGGRLVGSEQLLRQQLMKGAVADVVIAHLSVETTLEGLGNATIKPAAIDAVLRDLHTEITHTDRMLLRLLGAKGFAVDGPGQLATTSELLADAYVTTPILEPTHD